MPEVALTSRLGFLLGLVEFLPGGVQQRGERSGGFVIEHALEFSADLRQIPRQLVDFQEDTIDPRGPVAGRNFSRLSQASSG